MSRKRSRNRPRAQPKDAPVSSAGGDQYTKYLPAWMKDGTTVPRPPRPRRTRAPRPVGGYTPGKFATSDPLS